GDTVNTASRMESGGEPDRINISETTYELVKEFFECEYRGKINAKGKGEIDMYFLEKIRPEFSSDQEGHSPNQKFLKRIDQLRDPWQFAMESQSDSTSDHGEQSRVRQGW
ncbi:MAG: hypothetical protein KDK30_14635, partial [Leptospiraceae bacterium]|nr:hypothetical protein [Leptospiraceae bacterium]